MKLRVTNILLLMEIGDANSWIRRCHWNFQMFVGWTTHGFLVFHVGGFRWVQHAPLECGNHFPILLRKKGCSSIPVAFPATGELGARDSAGSDKVHDILISCVDGDDQLTSDDLADMCVATLGGELLDPGSAVSDQVENMSHLQICWQFLGYIADVKSVKEYHRECRSVGEPITSRSITLGSFDADGKAMTVMSIHPALVGPMNEALLGPRVFLCGTVDHVAPRGRGRGTQASRRGTPASSRGASSSTSLPVVAPRLPDLLEGIEGDDDLADYVVVSTPT